MAIIHSSTCKWLHCEPEPVLFDMTIAKTIMVAGKRGMTYDLLYLTFTDDPSILKVATVMIEVDTE